MCPAEVSRLTISVLAGSEVAVEASPYNWMHTAHIQFLSRVLTQRQVLLQMLFPELIVIPLTIQEVPAGN